MIITSKGWTKPIKPDLVKFGSKVDLIATNHDGWEVQEFKNGIGWTNACTKSDNNKPFIMDTLGIAELLCEEIQKMNPGKRYRVYEALK